MIKNLQLQINKALKSTFVKTYLRLVPTIVGLSIIGTFFTTQTTQATQFLSSALSRFGIEFAAPPTISLPIDIITPLNDYRTDQSLAPLSENPILNELSNLIALTLANDPDIDEVDIERLAGVAGYDYSTIAYFATNSPLPLVTSPVDSWLTDNQAEILSNDFIEIGSSQITTPEPEPQLIAVVVFASPLKNQPTTNRNTYQKPTYYTGVQLWAEIQKYRREHGVPEFQQENTLCTIASIRVNQLIDLGTLDNHSGFEPLVDQFIEDKKITYGNVAENILSGYETPSEAVAAWDGSLGHQALMQDGSFVWGCAAANHGFAVLVAAY